MPAKAEHPVIAELSVQSRTSAFTGSSAFADDDDIEGGAMSTNELSGKLAIVTGAGRNIGRAIALALAADGASILINARSNRAEGDRVARETEAAGGKAIVHIGDVGDAAQVQAMAEMAVEHFGRIDILVNNAALRREKSFAEMTYSEWREILDVTLDGAFHCTKACLP